MSGIYVCLSACLSVCLSVCMYVCMYVSALHVFSELFKALTIMLPQRKIHR